MDPSRDPCPGALRRAPLFAALVLAAALPSAVAAQRAQGGPPASDARMLELAVKAGFDFDQQAPVVGGFLRLPVDPWRRFALMPGAEVEFLNAGSEWQINADAVVLLGGSRSMFLGAGGAFRSAHYPDAPDQGDIRTGYSLIAGLRSPGRGGGFGNQFEFRYINVDAYEPRVVSIGFTWGMPLPF